MTMLQGIHVEGTFDTAAYDFVKKVEGFHQEAYLDRKKIPTIGVGYALIVKNSLNQYVPRDTAQLQADFSGIHEFSDSELAFLEREFRGHNT
jgi:GH24 family phage-related lysozyme (muramidase)